MSLNSLYKIVKSGQETGSVPAEALAYSTSRCDEHSQLDSLPGRELDSFEAADGKGV